MPKKKRKSKATSKPFWGEERLWRIIGLFLLLFGFYLGVAMLSYIISFDEDYSWVTGGGPFVASEVKNWLGPVGATLAHAFSGRLFGLASFGFLVFFFVFGVNFLFSKRLFKPLSTTFHTLVIMVLLSLTFSYAKALFFPETAYHPGGAWGYFVAGREGLLFQFLKSIGAGAFILFLWLAYAIWKLKLRPETLLTYLTSLRKEKGVSGNEEEKQTIIQNDETLFEKDGIEEEEKEEETEQHFEEKNEELVEEEEKLGVKESERKEDTVQPELDIEVEEAEEEEEPELEVEERKEEEMDNRIRNAGNYDPTADLSSYEYPPLNLLEQHGDGKLNIDKAELEANKDRIVETLRNYKIEIAKIKATIGPTITLYEIVPAKGVRISKIKNLEDDIALSLAALGIRIIAPIPGKGTIGIEVPNAKKEIVSSRSVLTSKTYRETDYELPIALGKTISNEVFMVDLARMPHMLMAGATGQGKSVGINQILVSLLYKKHPSQLKLVLVDPKKVELSLYNMIEKHFLAKLPDEEEPIITETTKVVKTLNSLCKEMDLRYDLLKEARARNIKEYNKKFVARKLNPEKGHRFMPYIVLVIDEFADLIMTAGKEVETPVARLAQLARAIGIHLILATQRPSVNIITGVIKANFPARISFRVTSKVDSRTILDASGADQLIGKGDMLFSQGSDIIRLQCAFVDTPEVSSITEFIANQQGYPSAFELPEVAEASDEGGGGTYDPSDRDELFAEAAHLVVMHQSGSTSLIQRKLKLGYNRAGRIMDQLEDAGIVGPNVGSKARDVLYATEADLEQYLKQLL